MEKSNQFLTPAEVAKELQLDVLTIYKYIRNMELAAIKLGRNYRIRREDLDKFIRSNRTF